MNARFHLCWVPLCAAVAVAAPVETRHPLETDPGCDPDLGTVSLQIGVYGSLGSDTVAADPAFFTAGDPPPFIGPTLTRAQAHVCAEHVGGFDGGWLDEPLNGAMGDGDAAGLTSQFIVGDLLFDFEALLDCNLLRRCLVATNIGVTPYDDVHLVQYLGANIVQHPGMGNDRALVSLGDPLRVGVLGQADIQIGTGRVHLYTDPQVEAVMSGWEVADAAEAFARVGDIGVECEPLVGGLVDGALLPADADEDGMSDAGGTWAASMRWSLGPLNPGESSVQACHFVEWQAGEPCNDPDLDGVCAPDDNCPFDPNALQEDADNNGVGDACQAGFPMETAPGCAPEDGHVTLEIDAYGATGAASVVANGAVFDPDGPLAAGQTVFDSAIHVCSRNAADNHIGWWLAAQQGDALGMEAGGEYTHSFAFEGFAVDAAEAPEAAVSSLEVDVRASFDCNLLRRCYVFTNAGDEALTDVEAVAYVDGDLEFVPGIEDFGGTSFEAPRVVYEYDQGDDPQATTTHLSLFGDLDAEGMLAGWEVAGFPDSRERISRVFDGCEPLRDGLTDAAGANTDVDGDLLTDAGYDVTLALRWALGPLAVGESTPELCVNLQWGVGAACSDEDEDTVCFDVDNCPLVPNLDQADDDQDGIGDACDVCPGQDDADFPGAGDLDEDGVIDPCDVCPEVADPGQEDGDDNGVGDACEPEPDAAIPDGALPDMLPPDAAPDAAPDMLAPDGAPDMLAPDAAPDGAAPDAAPDMAADAKPDVMAADAKPDDAAADATPGDAAPDAKPDGAAADGKADDAAPDAAAPDAAPGPDRDEDGVPDDADNCPYAANADQGDEDEDGVGDVCDTNDGNEQDDVDIHGLGFKGGGGCTVGARSPAPTPWLALLLLGVRRRETSGRG